MKLVVGGNGMDLHLGSQISATDLDDCVAKVEERCGIKFQEGEVVHTFGQTNSALTINREHNMPGQMSLFDNATNGGNTSVNVLREDHVPYTANESAGVLNTSQEGTQSTNSLTQQIPSTSSATTTATNASNP